MAQFSNISQERLATCHPQLIRLMNIVVLTYDIVIICGHRNESEQMVAFNANPQRSKKKWPDSKHNLLPSLAVDIAPYNHKEVPINWKDVHAFNHLGGYVRGIAEIVGIPIRWGADWDNDFNLKEETFIDCPHFELNL